MLMNSTPYGMGSYVRIPIAEVVAWETLNIHFTEGDVRLLHIFRSKVAQRLHAIRRSGCDTNSEFNIPDNFICSIIAEAPRDQQRSIFRVLDDLDRKTHLLIQSYEALQMQIEEEQSCLRDIVQRIIEWWNVASLTMSVFCDIDIILPSPTRIRTHTVEGKTDSNLNRHHVVIHKGDILQLGVSISTLGKALLNILDEVNQVSLGVTESVENPFSSHYVTACRAHTYDDTEIVYITTYEYNFPESLQEAVLILKNMRLICSAALQSSNILPMVMRC